MSNNAGAGDHGLGKDFRPRSGRASMCVLTSFPVKLIKSKQLDNVMISYLGGCVVLPRSFLLLAA